MPLQNRVQRNGAIVAIRERGTMMGNRGGRIHDPATRLLHPTRRWASRRWICCVNEFRQRQRTVMGAGYTELFFLDEITALSAGHRPCFECRRIDALRFADAWARAHDCNTRPFADQMDLVLHKERTSRIRRKGRASDLPEGGIFKTGTDMFAAVRGNGYLRWSPGGYEAAFEFDADDDVEIVTTPSILAALAAGYRPLWHPTAGSDRGG